MLIVFPFSLLAQAQKSQGQRLKKEAFARASLASCLSPPPPPPKPEFKATTRAARNTHNHKTQAMTSEASIDGTCSTICLLWPLHCLPLSLPASQPLLPQTLQWWMAALLSSHHHPSPLPPSVPHTHSATHSLRVRFLLLSSLPASKASLPSTTDLHPKSTLHPSFTQSEATRKARSPSAVNATRTITPTPSSPSRTNKNHRQQRQRKREMMPQPPQAASASGNVPAS